MGTRSGSLDASIALRLAKENGADEAECILNSQSGLLALAGTNDMAQLEARDDPRAKFAIDHFCYWAARHAASMCVAMGGVDAIAFTGGIGENSDFVRGEILQLLAFLGPLPVHIVQAKEERQIAMDTLAVLSAGRS
jgi:acetate kinase